MTAQIILDRENGGVALLGSAIVVIVTYIVAGSAETLMPAALALVVISSLGMLFVERNRIGIGVASGLILISTPAVWGLAPRGAIGWASSWDSDL